MLNGIEWNDVKYNKCKKGLVNIEQVPIVKNPQTTVSYACITNKLENTPIQMFSDLIDAEQK